MFSLWLTKYYNDNDDAPAQSFIKIQLIWSWYTDRWWVGCYTWYSEEGMGGAAAGSGPSSLY